METLEKGTHPDDHRHEYTILKNNTNEYFLDLSDIGRDPVDETDTDFFATIGVDFIEWIEPQNIARISLHFPESIYGNKK